MSNACFVLGLSIGAASLGPVSAFTAPLSVRSSHRQYRGGNAQQQQSLRMTASENTPADARSEVRVSVSLPCHVGGLAAVGFMRVGEVKAVVVVVVIMLD